MTLEDIERIDKSFLTAVDVAPYIRCDPGTLRLAAHMAPQLLGFPVVVMGHRVKIPKLPFIQFCRGGMQGFGLERKNE